MGESKDRGWSVSVNVSQPPHKSNHTGIHQRHASSGSLRRLRSLGSLSSSTKTTQKPKFSFSNTVELVGSRGKEKSNAFEQVSALRAVAPGLFPGCSDLLGAFGFI